MDGWVDRWMDGWYIMLLGSLALPDWVRHTWRERGRTKATNAPPCALHPTTVGKSAALVPLVVAESCN